MASQCDFEMDMDMDMGPDSWPSPGRPQPGARRQEPGARAAADRRGLVGRETWPATPGDHGLLENRCQFGLVSADCVPGREGGREWQQ